MADSDSKGKRRHKNDGAHHGCACHDGGAHHVLVRKDEAIMDPCYRCGGLLAMQYDVMLREEEPICVNCGARPTCKTRYVDGRSREEDPLCADCGRRPRIIYTSFRGHEQASRTCLECRLKDRERRKTVYWKHRKKLGNVRQVNTFLFT